MAIDYADINDRPFLRDAAAKRAGDIEGVFGSGGAVELSWQWRPEAAPRELLFVARDNGRQAEEPITATELFDGNGSFTEKLKRMKDALTHNGEWRVAVRNLIGDARTWCEALPSAVLEDREVTLNEERSGRYRLPALTVRSGNSIMWVEPVAGWVVNPTWVERTPPEGTHQAIGRADLKGPGGPIHLYCLSNRQWVYQARALSPDSTPMSFNHLDRDAFLKLARVCLDV